MRQVQRWLPVALFLLAAGARAETIREVEFRGLHLLAEETVRYYLGLVDGQELDERRSTAASRSSGGATSSTTSRSSGSPPTEASSWWSP
jgi:hypothetical protein